MQWRQEQCRSCNAPVVWARTAFQNVPMPLDWEPASDGNILVLNEDRIIRAVVLPPGDERIATQTTYTSHFATCPDGGKWRRRSHG